MKEKQQAQAARTKKQQELDRLQYSLDCAIAVQRAMETDVQSPEVLQRQIESLYARILKDSADYAKLLDRQANIHDVLAAQRVSVTALAQQLKLLKNADKIEQLRALAGALPSEQSTEYQANDKNVA